jgi:hypothetical protein
LVEGIKPFVKNVVDLRDQGEYPEYPGRG